MRVTVALFLQCGSKAGGDSSWFRAFIRASIRCSTLVEYLGCANVGRELGFGYFRCAESFVVANRTRIQNLRFVFFVV